jgi:hypothetical protein
MFFTNSSMYHPHGHQDEKDSTAQPQNQQNDKSEDKFPQNTFREPPLVLIPVYRCSARFPDWKYYMTDNLYNLPRDFVPDFPKSPFSGVDSSQSGTVEVHRYRSLIDPDQGYCYFVPKVMKELEWRDDGVVAYLFSSQKLDSVPIWRQYKLDPYREVLNFGDEQGGWTNIEIVGYGFKNEEYN